MSEQYLVSLFIGPVQDFIAAALRTRDLWFGSYMLSEVSRAAAGGMVDSGAQLIFPHTVTNIRNVANRVLALTTVANRETVIKAGKEAAHKKMQEFLDQAKRASRKIANSAGTATIIDDNIWNAQADPEDLLELYCTAVPVDGNYADARRRLDQLTMARKNSHDFFPARYGVPGRPKSSLDGRRETVLVDPDRLKKSQNKIIRRRLRMGNNEQLDTLGLVKRLAGGKADQFTPTTRMAVDPWIRKVEATERDSATLKSIRAELDRLADLQAPCISRVKGNRGIYDAMPYDAGLLYPGPLGAALRDSEDDREKDILQYLKKTLGSGVWQTHGKPCPYYSLLLGDGDYMGDLLDKAGDAQAHQEISRQLATFAASVPEMCRKYRGHCIYAGGDDILAMAPLDKAFDLAYELQDSFGTFLETAGEGKRPTFSIGLVVAHMQTPLGRVRRLVNEAEKFAKEGQKDEEPRNGLAILVAPRSGRELTVRFRWDDDRLPRFRKLVELYQQEELPSRFGYSLQQLAHELPNTPGHDFTRIHDLELQRILKRKNNSGGQETIDQETIKLVMKHAASRSLDTIFREHLVARWFSGHVDEQS